LAVADACRARPGDECSAAIKAMYLKNDVCRWRKISAMADEGCEWPPAACPFERFEDDDARVLDASSD
jgi:hypothetical protein